MSTFKEWLARLLFERELREHATDLVRMAGDRERLALQYDLSDPYLAGVNSGRAEALRKQANDILNFIT